MITRRKDYSKQLPSKDARKLYLFCEGEGTEPDYFAFFKYLSTNLEIISIPPESGTDPLKLRELASEKFLDEGSQYMMDYRLNDSVWFVIDTDTWDKEGKIVPLRDFCARMNNEFILKYSEVKPYDAWNVVQSNPCFEIWLYYHFYKELPDSQGVDAFPSFKAYVDSLIKGGFDYQNDPVRIIEAVENARVNMTRDPEGKPCLYSTEVYELAEVIIPFVRQHLERLRRKMI